jgi:hypothetical protein
MVVKSKILTGRQTFFESYKNVSKRIVFTAVIGHLFTCHKHLGFMQPSSVAIKYMLGSIHTK